MIILARPSPNFNDRRDGMGVSMLVLHYTGMQSGQAAIDRLCDPDAQVSAHYVVNEQGEVFQLVDEAKRAWHAGVGFWRGQRDINSASVGIEIINPGHEFGYVPFPQAQMQAVVELSQAIVLRHDIKPYNVVGHSDIAPARKEDPGEYFDWQGLARMGAGIWAEEKPSTVKAHAGLMGLLSDIGYEVDAGNDGRSVIAAFQRHWRPTNITGKYDQQTADIAFAVASEVKRLT